VNKYTALVLVVAALVIGVVASYFINSGFSVNVESDLKVKIGKEQEPVPVIHYHIEKKGVWGA